LIKISHLDHAPDESCYRGMILKNEGVLETNTLNKEKMKTKLLLLSGLLVTGETKAYTAIPRRQKTS